MTMRKDATTLLALFLAVLVIYGCNAPEQKPAVQSEPPAQQAATPPPPKVSINATMVALVDHASHVIWEAADRKKAPKTERDWRELEHHAIQLAGAGSLITLGGAGKADAGWVQQATWKKYSDDLANAGIAALDAARAKNSEAISKAGDQLVETCESCHKEFKPDAPTEGILHPHEAPPGPTK